MLTPIDRTLAAQSATRRVVSLAAWMPLSVNCTKLMYVGMMVLLQVIPESVSAERPGSAAPPGFEGGVRCSGWFGATAHHRLTPLSLSQQDCPEQPGVTEDQPGPGQDAQRDRERDREHPAPRPDVDRGRAAEVAGQQNRPEDRGLRDGIDRGAQEQYDADPDDRIRRNPELRGGLDDGCRLDDLRHGVERQEGDHQA